jgi:hypothetical protein
MSVTQMWIDGRAHALHCTQVPSSNSIKKEKWKVRNVGSSAYHFLIALGRADLAIFAPSVMLNFFSWNC